MRDARNAPLVERNRLSLARNGLLDKRNLL